jgi:hypothetical protein
VVCHGSGDVFEGACSNFHGTCNLVDSNCISLVSGVPHYALVNQEYFDRCTVRTVNFTQEADSDWRSPRYGRFGYNVAFYNTTPPPPEASVADWYDQPSFQCDRITKLSFYSKQVVPEKTSPCFGFNCTYEIEVS